MDRGRDRGVLGTDRLHGTATVEYREERKSFPGSACQSQTFDQRIKKQRKKRLKTIMKACFPCICKETESFSLPQTPASHEERDEQISITHICTQEYDKDAYYRHLIANTGRPVYLPQLVSPKEIQVSIRNGANEENEQRIVVNPHETLPKTGSDTTTSPPVCSPETEERQTVSGSHPHHSPCLAPRENSARNLGHRFSRETGVVPGKQAVRHHDGKDDAGMMTELKSVETDATSSLVEDLKMTQVKSVETNATHSIVDDVKRAVRVASAGLNQPDAPQNFQVQRPSVRERSLFARVSKFERSQPKYFFTFRRIVDQQNPHPIQMMTSSNESDTTSSEAFCYPSHSDIGTRRQTLRNCTDEQLRGYGRGELAVAGWFFNGRTLTTFCCGMEMHTFTNYDPLDVHLGLTPHCRFALGLQSSSQESREGRRRTEHPGGGDQASGGVGFCFSTPVQVTDDAPGQLGVAEWGLPNISEDFPAVTFEETTPGDHWMTDGAAIGGSQTSNVSYPGNLVTNSTDMSLEQWQPFTPNPQQRARSSTQNAQSRQRTQASGQLSMRFNAQNPFAVAVGNHGVVENLGRESPPTVYPGQFGHQLNIEGSEVHEHIPRYPHLGFAEIRLTTYEGWPAGHTQTASSLVDAGFFYAGYDDSVVCYCCGIGARHWLPSDDPWIEHARLRPSCVFVNHIQGQHFIDAARELTRNNQHPTYREVRLEANRRRRAGETASGGDASATASRGDEDEAALDLLCRVCYTRDRNTMLMPCRHLAVCEGCGRRAHSCPVCRAGVESFFQTFQ